MPTICDVENQRFEFSDQWSIVFKYDDTKFHQNEATKLQGRIDDMCYSTKAVDLIGLHKNSGLLLLEAKDFRGHRIANQSRMKGEVSTEVAVKVRDTLAALVGAARKSITEFPSKDLVSALKHGKEVTVVLWLEDDTFVDVEKAKVSLGVLNQKLKSKLSWLNARTFVTSSSVIHPLHDLIVSNLPGAGQPNP